MTTPVINNKDVEAVAEDLGFTLTKSQIDWVILCYDDSQRQDPTGTWNLIVEDLIHCLLETS